MSQQLENSDVVNIPVKQKHSVMGILSFLISLPAGFLYFIIVDFLLAPTVMHHMGLNTAGIGIEFPVSILIMLFLVFLLLLQAVAFGLGFAVLFMKNRIKMFAILGMVLSGFSFLLTALVYFCRYLSC